MERRALKCKSLTPGLMAFLWSDGSITISALHSGDMDRPHAIASVDIHLTAAEFAEVSKLAASLTETVNA